MADEIDSPVVSAGQYLTFRNCLHCGEAYTRSGRELRKYCSDECAKERKKLLRKGLIKRTCEWCSESLDGMPSAQKFCCDECRGKSAEAYNREYHVANADAINAKARAYQAKQDRALRSEIARQWVATNKDRLNAARRSPEYRKKAATRLRRRNANDPHWRLHNRMSSAVYQALSENKAGRKWETLVGYTLEDLHRHLERQFLPGMTWDNMGKWHIDHILPRAMFRYETSDCPEFRACWAITNLRPLWSIDNQAKHAKRTLLI